MPRAPETNPIPLKPLPAIQGGGSEIAERQAERLTSGPAAQGLAKATRGFTREVQDQLLRQRDEADKLAVLEKSTELGEYMISQKEAFNNVRGKDAAEQSGVFLSDFDEKVNELGADLNNAQRAMFKVPSASQSLNFRSHVETRTNAEINTYFTRVNTANVALQIKDASAHRTPDSLAVAVENVARTRTLGLQELGAPDGRSAEEKELDAKEAAGQLTTGAINNMINLDVDNATKMLDRVEGSLLKDTVTKLRQTISTKKLLEDSAGLWDAFQNTGTKFKTKGGGWDLPKMRKSVNSQFKTEEKRQKAWNYIKGQVSEEAAVKRQEEQEKAEITAKVDGTLYISQVSGSLKREQLDSLLAAGTITPAIHERHSNRLNKRNNDPAIDPREKSERYRQIFEQFVELSGTKVDRKKGKLVQKASGNDRDRVAAFRKFVSESAGYLTPAQEMGFYQFTQENYDETDSKKIGTLKGFHGRMVKAGLDSVGTANALSFLFNAIMDKSVTSKESEAAALEIGDNAVAEVNKDGIQFVRDGDTQAANGKTVKMLKIDSEGFIVIEVPD